MNSFNFPYSPAWWQCCISLPDEADKVLVGREGSLLLDFERDGLGHRSFRTVIEPALPVEATFVTQELFNPKVPIVSNHWDVNGLQVRTEVFSVTPPDEQFALPVSVEREGGEEATAGWDGPKVPRIKKDFYIQKHRWGSIFQDVAWSETEIVYIFRVPCGASRYVAIGLAEGEYTEEGKRILQIEADGATPMELDTVGVFGNEPGICGRMATDTDGDGLLRVRISASANSPTSAAFVNAIWLFEECQTSEEDIFSGKAKAETFVNCGHSTLPRRQFLLRMELKNPTHKTIPFEPTLRIRTLEKIQHNKSNLAIGATTQIVTPRPLLEKGDGLFALTPENVRPGEKKEFIIVFNRHGYQGQSVDAKRYSKAREQAIAYWSSLDLPYGKIEIPDQRIQALIDSSIRNIYQARDMEYGLPAFHVGPTCYRQLWIVDGAFLLELVTMLGRAEEAHSGIAYILRFQEADGGFQLKARYWKETGIVLWTLVRQAMLSGDQEWLRSHWPQLVRAVDCIIALRTKERAGDPTAPEFRLAPYGDIDGGLSNVWGESAENLPEYSNVYWLLIGLKAATEAADWLGLQEEKNKWSSEYADFLKTFRKAAERDMQEDSHGNSYLPIRIGASDLAQKAQWAFCHAVYPGKIFEPNDPFVTNMLAMLDATKVEGLVFDTGWMSEGLWTYFASFFGHAQLWQQNPKAAFAALKAFADHSSPVLVWREEQKPLGCGNEEVGDMPHNWASAEFIRLAFHLISMERGTDLHLFEGVPSEWIQPDKEIRLRSITTAFGPLTAKLCVSKQEILVEIEPLLRGCTQIVIHSSAWDHNAPLKFPANQAIRHTYPFPIA